MKMCMPHWDDLKKAIDERGLTKFIARDGAQAQERLTAQLDPAAQKIEGFDPLLNANFAIWNNGLQAGGLYMVGDDDAGNPYCPLCELEKHGGRASDWIGHAADDQSQVAIELKLLPGETVQ